MASTKTDKYGLMWPTEASDIEIELAMFRYLMMPLEWFSNPTCMEKPISLNRACLARQGGTRPWEHFKNIVRILWPDFKWHPWAEDMLEAACLHNYVAFAGSASCGKSYFLAAWGIVNYLAHPEKTLVLMTSTTQRDAKKRIWGGGTKTLVLSYYYTSW